MTSRLFTVFLMSVVALMSLRGTELKAEQEFSTGRVNKALMDACMKIGQCALVTQEKFNYIFVHIKKILIMPINYCFGEESSHAKTAFYQFTGAAILAKLFLYFYISPGLIWSLEEKQVLANVLNNKLKKIGRSISWCGIDGQRFIIEKI